MLFLNEKTFKADASLPDWMRARQKTAIEKISNIPFPSNKQEHWKYLPMEKLRDIKFETVAIDSKINALLKEFESTIGNESYKIFLFNGRIIKIDKQLQTIIDINQFSKCGTVKEQFYTILEKPHTSDPFFYYLNSRMLLDGLLIEIPKNVSLKLPIHIINLGVCEESSITSPKLGVKIGPNSKVKLIEEFSSKKKLDSLTNSVTQIEIGRNACLFHDRIVSSSTHDYHFGQLHFDLAENACLHSNSIAIDGKITRIDLGVSLNEKGSQCNLKGLYLCKDESIVDHHTAIFHNSKHTKSSELYRGVINDKGLGVFNGKVVVDKGISDVSATQYNNNLLLSDLASANTKPELQIYSDDVRCAHGATIGQLDLESLFYLRSRGISKDKAQKLLVRGFIEEVLSENYQFTNREFITNSLGFKEN